MIPSNLCLNPGSKRWTQYVVDFPFSRSRTRLSPCGHGVIAWFIIKWVSLHSYWLQCWFISDYHTCRRISVLLYIRNRDDRYHQRRPCGKWYREGVLAPRWTGSKIRIWTGSNLFWKTILMNSSSLTLANRVPLMTNVSCWRFYPCTFFFLFTYHTRLSISGAQTVGVFNWII